jgi:hypothetical protein
MPALVRHAGVWEGTCRAVDSAGVGVDRHASRIEVSFPDDGPNVYVQKNRGTWPDGLSPAPTWHGFRDGHCFQWTLIDETKAACGLPRAAAL